MSQIDTGRDGRCNEKQALYSGLNECCSPGAQDPIPWVISGNVVPILRMSRVNPCEHVDN